jgi:Co/Zn/Cd efflux system component
MAGFPPEATTMGAVWLYSRNDAIGNVAVMLAAVAVVRHARTELAAVPRTGRG